MVKTLLKSVREYKKQSILCPIVMVGEAVMEILIPFFMAEILDKFDSYVKGNPLDISYIIVCALIMIDCAVFALLC